MCKDLQEKRFLIVIEKQETRKEIFNDTKKCYQSNKILINSIKNSKKYQLVITENDNIKQTDYNIYDIPANVIVSKKRSLEASMEYKEQKVCILNFASATKTGGGVEKGANAQEEAICRCSTLYPCISDREIVNQFHNKHRELLKTGKLNALYNDDCIYTPNVIVFKTDTNNPELMAEKDWYKIDVISCAAPNLRRKPSNTMNPNSGKAVDIEANTLLNLHIKRIKKVLDIAKANLVEVVILGAFGCGVFQNPPEIVAEAMAKVIKDYLYNFKTIEFAVYCSTKNTKNYDVFYDKLS